MGEESLRAKSRTVLEACWMGFSPWKHFGNRVFFWFCVLFHWVHETGFSFGFVFVSLAKPRTPLNWGTEQRVLSEEHLNAMEKGRELYVFKYVFLIHFWGIQ